MNEQVYGECGKHPGNNMVSCSECSIEDMINKNKPKWWKAPIESKGINPCLCCNALSEILPLETLLFNGFGGWSVNKNGQQFYQAEPNDDFENAKTLNDIEEIIGHDTENEYLAILFTPLRGATFQRHAKDNWVLIEKNGGFA